MIKSPKEQCACLLLPTSSPTFPHLLNLEPLSTYPVPWISYFLFFPYSSPPPGSDSVLSSESLILELNNMGYMTTF